MAGKLRVFLADANEDFRLLMWRLIEGEGDMEVAGATGNGYEALKLIEELKPDVLLTDLVLQGMDGIELLRSLPETGLNIGSIVISGFVNEQVISRCSKLGAYYFMLKPCDMPILFSRIREVNNSVNSAGNVLKIHVSPVPQGPDVEDIVTDALHEMCIPAHTLGYRYLRVGIISVVEQGGVITTVSKNLYPEIAEKCDSTKGRVERAIRTSIESAWKKGDIEAQQRVFGDMISKDKGKPTNLQFIATMSEYVLHKMKSIDRHEIMPHDLRL